jgi:hypothetical protein
LAGFVNAFGERGDGLGLGVFVAGGKLFAGADFFADGGRADADVGSRLSGGEADGDKAEEGVLLHGVKDGGTAAARRLEA